MDTEYIQKSRLYLDNFLPGGIIRLRNQAYAKVVGTRNNPLLLTEVDPLQLVETAARFARDWAETEGGTVDTSLMQALADQKVAIQSPADIYVRPYPLILRCSQCKVLDFYATRQADQETIARILRRVAAIDGRKGVRCKHPDCGGRMVQLPYLAVHRCGLAGPITIPFTARRVEDIALKESGGAFFLNSFINQHTGERLAIAFQDNCDNCAHQFGKDAMTGKRGTPITSGESFYPHHVQYIALTLETGALVSDLRGRVATAGGLLRGIAGDIAEGLACGLLGLATGTDLVKQLTALLDEEGAPGVDLAAIHHKLNKKRKARDKFAALAETDDDMAEMLASTKQEIKRLERRLELANGRFKAARDFLDDDTTLAALAGQRRSMESVFLRNDFKGRSFAEYLREDAPPGERAAMAGQWERLRSRYGIENIVHLPDLRVVLSTIGYTRERRTPLDGLDTGDVPVKLNGFEDQNDESLRGKSVLYAMSAQTEALLIRLDPCRVLEWCVKEAGWERPTPETLVSAPAARAHLLSLSQPLILPPSGIRKAMWRRPLQESAPFHLLHTVSHCLLGTARRHSGYEDKSLMEYLLPMDLSFLLYVTSVQNYTSGGLLSLFKHHLSAWFQDASLHAFTCAFDPLCSDRGGACSGCVETVLGCETFNHGLSRAYLHGGAVDDAGSLVVERGYWTARL